MRLVVERSDAGPHVLKQGKSRPHVPDLGDRAGLSFPQRAWSFRGREGRVGRGSSGDNARVIIPSWMLPERCEMPDVTQVCRNAPSPSRARTPQPTVARIESRAVVPRLDTLDRLLTACGQEALERSGAGAGVDRTQVWELRRLSPIERLRAAVAEARALDRFLAGAKRR